MSTENNQEEIALATPRQMKAPTKTTNVRRPPKRATQIATVNPTITIAMDPPGKPG
jgi:hypothetical protein